MDKIKGSKRGNSALIYCQGFFVAMVLSASLFLSSCATMYLTPQQFHRALPPLGSDYKKVKGIYGRPDNGINLRVQGKIISVWEYRLGSDYSVLFYFDNGVLTAIQE